MFLIRILPALALAVGCARAVDISAGDASRGAQIFETEQCSRCHSVNGRGGTIAPDLARRVDRDYTPAVMAALMWNHAPEMWEAMRKYGVTRGDMTPDKAADLFAYFLAARYFEKPGDAGRGKAVFTAKHCTECHGITSSPLPSAPPVAKWDSLADPVVLAQQMWNHGTQMRAEFARKKLTWPQLTAQELTDMLVYLQNLPQTRKLAENFQFAPSANGAALFQSKGCVECHAGKVDLQTLLKNQTITQIAADMWDHQPSMKPQPPTFSQEEMRQLLAYIWARQYFSGNGNAERGKKVFDEKSCATCHNNPSSGAPSLAQHQEPYSDITMISVLWTHGPRMLESMTQQKIAWPRFTAAQMSDLIAYLNSKH
jgi:mono/diheme cytochrome c family protein